MRTSALLSLLPLLVAGIATAHPHPHTSSGVQKQRKSISYGPSHPHKTFEGADQSFTIAKEYDGDWKEVVKVFLGDKIGDGSFGDGWFIRDDSYTDTRTGLTHVYVRQLIHGLEVSDGDINLNIDSTGRVVSWGNSFHPSTHSKPIPFSRSEGIANEAVCSEIAAAGIQAKDVISEHLSTTSGPWGLVKSAAKAAFGFGGEEQGEVSDEVIGARHQLRKADHHYTALCSTPLSGDEILTPIQALAHVLPKLQAGDDLVPISVDDLDSHPEHTFAPKNAPNEPPTERITGKGLDVSGVVNPVPARLMYTQIDAGVPRMVWKFEIEMKENWYETYVDIYSGEIVRIVDWANDISWATPKGGSRDAFKGGKQKPLPSPHKGYKPYSYQVFPWGVNDPTVGNLSIETKPWDTTASPLGWHEIPTSANPWPNLKGSNSTKNATTFYTTAGNNVIAHEDWEGQNNYVNNYRPINESMVFVYDYEEPLGLAPKEYVDFVVTQLFYTSNMYHDLLHRLGFDEQSGNFQAYNFGKGGKGGDPVIANAQDGSGFNNANFMTPPDGTMPRMRMYVWDVATPWRDGDLEAGIVIHEYSHGLSTRLTGGPANSGCLGFGEAGGMGEGWGDAIATLIRQIEEHHQFKNGSDVYTMGSWAANNVRGIRNFPYSTNSTINPSTYKTLDKPGYWGVHAIGEVWAQFLFVMSQNLVEEYGFSPTLFPPTNTSEPNDYYTTTLEQSAPGKVTPLIPKHGNTLALQLIVDGLKIQPCRPSFFDARDAIIQADQLRTGGKNACTIWKSFASVGLGSDARVIGQTPWGGGVRTDGHSFPSAVCKKGKGKAE